MLDKPIYYDHKVLYDFDTAYRDQYFQKFAKNRTPILAPYPSSKISDSGRVVWL